LPHQQCEQLARLKRHLVLVSCASFMTVPGERLCGWPHAWKGDRESGDGRSKHSYMHFSSACLRDTSIDHAHTCSVQFSTAVANQHGDTAASMAKETVHVQRLCLGQATHMATTTSPFLRPAPYATELAIPSTSATLSFYLSNIKRVQPPTSQPLHPINAPRPRPLG
jgi:hypothetical protein